jgi:4'-phosphopantetheinyl transferase
VTGLSASRSSVSEQRLSLTPNAVHLWMCRVGAVNDPVLRETYPTLLNESERQQCASLHEQLRDEALLTRVLARTVLSRYAPLAPAAWDFERAVNGKPRVVEGAAPGLEFNLSHSHGWVVCAVSRGMAVGVDVEYCDGQRDFMRLAHRYFLPAEVAALEARNGEFQRDLFYELWTLKEAWSKFRGGNIGSAMGAVGFSLDRPGFIDITAAESEDQTDCWLLAPEPGFRLALCRGRQPSAQVELKVFESVPLRESRHVELPLLAVASGFAGAM